MSNAKTFFEQVPIELARKAAREAASCSKSGQIPCVLCGSPISLEDCKFDERGGPVHDNCYIEKLSRTAHPDGSKRKKKN